MNRTGTQAENQMKISQCTKCRWVCCRCSEPLLYLAIIEGLQDLLYNCWACQVLRMLTKIPHKLLKSSGGFTRQISIIPLSASLELSMNLPNPGQLILLKFIAQLTRVLHALQERMSAHFNKWPGVLMFRLLNVETRLENLGSNTAQALQYLLTLIEWGILNKVTLKFSIPTFSWKLFTLIWLTRPKTSTNTRTEKKITVRELILSSSNKCKPGAKRKTPFHQQQRGDWKDKRART